MDGLAVHHHRREQEPDAELFELDADGVGPLSDGVGKLATRQELGLPAAMGEEIRLRQSSEKVLLFKRMNDAGEITLSRSEDEATALERKIGARQRSRLDPGEAGPGHRPE